MWHCGPEEMSCMGLLHIYNMTVLLAPAYPSSGNHPSSCNPLPQSSHAITLGSSSPSASYLSSLDPLHNPHLRSRLGFCENSEKWFRAMLRLYCSIAVSALVSSIHLNISAVQGTDLFWSRWRRRGRRSCESSARQSRYTGQRCSQSLAIARLFACYISFQSNGFTTS